MRVSIQDWTGHWKKVWSCRHLAASGIGKAPGVTMGRRQASGGSTMLWASFRWKTVAPDIPLDVTFYFDQLPDHCYRPLAATIFSTGPIMHAATMQILFRNTAQGVNWVSEFSGYASEGLDRQVRSMEACPPPPPLHFTTDVNNLLLTSRSRSYGHRA